MTATLSQETYTFPETQHCDQVDQLTAPILERFEEVTTPGTKLHDAFYGDHSITQMPLREAPHPYAKGLLIQDETTHAFISGDGELIEVPTFKFRGARVRSLVASRDNDKLTTLSAASQGNHALGVAAAANLLGIQAEVHLPQDAPEVKKDRIRALGATVIDHYPDLSTAMLGARADGDPDRVTIHPFDHPDVIAGQATVGEEMLQSLYAKEAIGMLDLQSDEVTILSPVGGGGLATGIAVAVKRARDQGRIGDNVRFVPVQIEDKEHNAWSDGTRTSLGYIASEVLTDRRYADETLTVPNVWVAEAMIGLKHDLRKTVEPAGAIALAGALKLGHDLAEFGLGSNMTYVVPVTGTGVSAEVFAKAVELHYQAYLDGVDLPSLTSRFVYEDADDEQVFTAVGTHAAGLLNQNQYGRYPV